MQCPDCGTELPEDKVSCPRCGASRGASANLAKTPAGERSATSAIPTQAPRGEGEVFGSPSSPAPRLSPGTTLGARYRIVALAGAGGMGEVYRAEDLKLGQTVALKLIREGTGRKEAALARLLDEVRIARQVSHPNVCRVYDVGEADGHHFISMEWIEGEDLSALLRRRGRLPADRALSVARQICAGLAAAHECRVLHRDLKPANVMLDERGVARITDFGLARTGTEVSGARSREGTPEYMSPEQHAGDQVTVQSDLYALGLVLYEIFTGKAAFPGATFDESMQRRREPPPSPSRSAPEIDPGVERLILRCLEADPARRPASARELLDALPGEESLSRALAAAQRRADRIAAFRAEMTELRRAGLLRIGAEEMAAVDSYHSRALQDLVRRFDVDLSERGKQLSLGMRAISTLAAIALAASVYYFFYRFWGAFSTPLQAGILTAAPILALLLTAGIGRRERARYFTGLAALTALAALIVDTTLLQIIFNMAPSVLELLAWGAFALLLAYAYRVRLLLVVGLALLAAFSAGALHALAGGDWQNFLERPESLFPAGLALLALALAAERRQPPGFASVVLLEATVFLVGPVLLLAMSPWSYLPADPRATAVVYQVLGFVLSAGAIWLGLARRWKEAVYGGALFFAAFLLVKFVHWWWAWMPKYLFFLIVALTALGMLGFLRRLRATLTARMQEAPS